MIIRKIKDNERGEFDRLAEQHGSIFIQQTWLKLFGDLAQVYGIFQDQDKLIGGFILYKERKWGINIYRNLPFTPTNGLFILNPSQNQAKKVGTQKKIMSDLADFYQNLPYQIVFVHFPVEFIDLMPFYWRKFKVVPFYTYQIELFNITAGEIFNNFSPERRNDIKKAESEKLTVVNEENNEILMGLVLKTFRRQNKAINTNYLRKILFEFANENNSYAYITYNEGKPVAGAFFIHDSKTAFYMLGGYDSALKHQGAGALTLWKGIQHAKNMNLEVFDFEGSMVREVEKFFRGFGGIVRPYYSVNKAIFPLEIVLKFIKRELF